MPRTLKEKQNLHIMSSVALHVDVAAAEKDLASLDKHVARFFGIIYHL